jgi:leucyl aminopeptidase
MNVKVVRANIQDYEADALVVNLFEGVTAPGGATGAVDHALGGQIGDLIAGGDFQGKLAETAVLYSRGVIPAKRVILVGLGKQEKFDLEAARRAAGAAAQQAQKLRLNHLATIAHGGGLGGLDAGDAAQATVEGTLSALYQFEQLQSPAEPGHRLGTLTVVERNAAAIEAVTTAATAAEAIMAGVYLARDLVNLPPNIATPTYMADAARQIAEAHNMAITVGDREWAAEHKMGAFLGVAQGAGEPPYFIVMEHNGDQTDLPAIVLVGKGITFDTGGISIKPTANMGDMKSDMGGAAAVLGTMKTVGLLNLPLRVIALAPCTENMPDALAYRPSDVLTASNGKTVEIISTDAEGRLILADALVYAKRYEPAAVIDLATLTGSCVIALGEGMAAALFATDDDLRDKLVAAGTQTHERVWPLPLWDDYREAIKSTTADIKNSGGRFGGVATSAIFLKEFVDGYPWVHLDIASMALADKAKGYLPVGGTGYGVRLLTAFLRQWNE